MDTRRQAHNYLVNKGCLSMGQTYSAFKIEEMLIEFSENKEKSIIISDNLKDKNMSIDKIINKWDKKHSLLLSQYTKLSHNDNEILKIYRSQMRDVLDFIEQLKQIKNDFL